MTSIKVIAWVKLSLFILPLSLLAFVYWKWCKDKMSFIYANLRMVSQLILVGFFLNYLFTQSSSSLILTLICIMTLIATWIALRPLQKKTFLPAFMALSLGSLPILMGVLFWVMELDSLENARVIIPLAGMILSNSMNALSIGMERFHHEVEQGKTYEDSRNQAFKTALLPSLNTFFALGLVALPGMMTGQILSGISPLLAVRYQIMVMAMTLSSAGFSVIFYLLLIKKQNLSEAAQLK